MYMAGLGLESAILGSAVRLTVGCAREHGIQKCGLFLRSQTKIWMYFLNVYIAAESPSSESEPDCESRDRWFDSGPATYLSLRLIMRIFFTDRKNFFPILCNVKFSLLFCFV